MRKHFPGRPAGALLVLGLLAGCGGGDADNAAPASTPAGEPAAAAAPASDDLIAQGGEVFAGVGICSTCHGQGGVGMALAPNLTDDVWLWVDASQPLQPQIERIVREGIQQPKEHPAPMPAMGGASLNDQQITAVAAYVASL